MNLKYLQFWTRRHVSNAIQLVAKTLAIFGLIGSLVLTVGCSDKKPQFSAVDITGAEYASGFSLKDQQGQLRTLNDFKGKVVVMFFGYTQCPDVCPTTMTDMAEVKKQLGSDADKLQVLFVSVDPERDTADVLKAYMANFDTSFLALRPEMAELPDLAKSFKVYYKKAEGRTPTSYTVDHSAGSFVFDTQGKVRLFTRYGTGPQPLLADIRLLLKQSS